MVLKKIPTKTYYDKVAKNYIIMHKSITSINYLCYKLIKIVSNFRREGN